MVGEKMELDWDEIKERAFEIARQKAEKFFEEIVENEVRDWFPNKDTIERYSKILAKLKMGVKRIKFSDEDEELKFRLAVKDYIKQYNKEIDEVIDSIEPIELFWYDDNEMKIDFELNGYKFRIVFMFLFELAEMNSDELNKFYGLELGYEKKFIEMEKEYIKKKKERLLKEKESIEWELGFLEACEKEI